MFSLCVTLMFSVRSEIVITGVGINSLCNFTKYYSCEISLNVNFNRVRVMIGFLVRGRVRIKIRIRVRVRVGAIVAGANVVHSIGWVKSSFFFYGCQTNFAMLTVSVSDLNDVIPLISLRVFLNAKSFLLIAICNSLISSALMASARAGSLDMLSGLFMVWVCASNLAIKA